MKRIWQKLNDNKLRLGVSIVLAVLIWLILINNANPIVEKTLTNVEVHIENAEAFKNQKLSYKITSNRTVSVVVRAHRKDIDAITSSDIYVYSDISHCFGVEEFSKASNIQFRIENHRNLISDDDVTIKGNPQLVIALEKIMEKSFPVRAELKGEFPENLYIDKEKIVFEPSTVTVTAPQSVMATISYVKVSLDVSHITEDTVTLGEGRVGIYDNNDLAVPTSNLGNDGSISASSVASKVEVQKYKEIQILVDNPSGTPADGYKFSGVDYSPKTVRVFGLKADLADLNSVTIKDEYMNIEGATGDLHRFVKIKNLLSNVTLDENEVKEVELNIRVEKLQTKKVMVPIENVNLANTSENYTYRFSEKYVELTLRGFASDLEKIDTSEIMMECNVVALTPGTREVTPNVLELKSGYELMEVTPVTLSVIAKIPQNYME